MFSPNFRKKMKEDAAKMLHVEQKKLVLEEEKVRQATKKLERVRQSRIKVENENKVFNQYQI